MKRHGSDPLSGAVVRPRDTTYNRRGSGQTLTSPSDSVMCLMRKWDVAQLVRASDRHAADAGSIPQLRQGIFLPESTFSADSFTVSVYPHVQSHASTSVRTLKIPWSMPEFGGL